VPVAVMSGRRLVLFLLGHVADERVRRQEEARDRRGVLEGEAQIGLETAPLQQLLLVLGPEKYRSPAAA